MSRKFIKISFCDGKQILYDQDSLEFFAIFKLFDSLIVEDKHPSVEDKHPSVEDKHPSIEYAGEISQEVLKYVSKFDIAEINFAEFRRYEFKKKHGSGEEDYHVICHEHLPSISQIIKAIEDGANIQISGHSINNLDEVGILPPGVKEAIANALKSRDERGLDKKATHTTTATKH